MVSSCRLPCTLVKQGASRYIDGKLYLKSWIGINGDTDGFDSEVNIFKCIVDNDNYAQKIFAVPSAPKIPAPNKPTTAASYGKHSKYTRPDPVPEDHEMPPSSRDTISHWFRQYPEIGFEALPCTMLTSTKSIVSTHQGEPIKWTNANGKKVRVSVYSLNGTLLQDGKGFRKIIVAQISGRYPQIVPKGIRPWTISRVSQYIDGRLACKLWLGIGGNREGWETGNYVFKCKARQLTEVRRELG